jgi:hypothetical protein
MRKTHQLTNQDVPMPAQYAEMMRHYLPDATAALIKDAWKHNATPAEVMAHIERIEEKGRNA